MGAAELSAFIRQALANHPTADSARASVDAAHAELSGARSARFPSLSVESFADARADETMSAAVILEQPLWSGGKIRAGIRLSEAGADAAEARRDESYLDLALRTVEAYVDVQTQHRRADILGVSLGEHQRLVESMRRRVDQEVSPASDLQLAQSRSRQTQIEVVQARTGAEIALLRLRQLVGDDRAEVNASFVFDEELPDIDAARLVDAAVAFDPSRRRAEAEAEIADADVSLNRSALRPQFGARYVRRMGADDDDQFGLVVRFETGGGLSRLAAVNASRQSARAARLSIDAAILEQRERVLAELAASAAALARAEVGREAVGAAQSVTDSFLRQFAAGRRTWPEVLNAVRETVAADLARVDAEGAARLSSLRLLLLSGQWQPWGDTSEQTQ